MEDFLGHHWRPSKFLKSIETLSINWQLLTHLQWAKGGYWGKYAGIFVSSGTPGGGQESTAIAAMSTLAHHGIIYVPLGYKTAFPQLANLSEVRGGSPWGAGTFAAADGSRQPTPLELELATIHGESFGNAILKVNFAWLAEGSAKEAPAAAKAENGATKTSGSAPAKPTTTANGSNSKKQESEEKDKEGPCGLPSKCTILWK